MTQRAERKDAEKNTDFYKKKKKHDSAGMHFIWAAAGETREKGK